MLLREHVVLGRAGRVSSSSRWRDVGVARQGVGGGCLGGHRSLRRRRCWQYLSCAARPTAGWWIFFNLCCWSFKVSQEPAPASSDVFGGSANASGRSSRRASRLHGPTKVMTTKACVHPTRGLRCVFSWERLQQSVVDAFRRLEVSSVFLVCLTSTWTAPSALFAVIARL